MALEHLAKGIAEMKANVPEIIVKMKDMNKLIVLYKLYHIEKYVTNGRNH